MGTYEGNQQGPAGQQPYPPQQMNYGNQPQQQHQPQMYQASDGKWYPTSAMPQGPPPQPHFQQQQQYQQYQPYQQHQPMIYQQQQSGGGLGAGGGCLAAACGALLCFNLGACLF